MFVDASAICAIMLRETDAADYSRCLEIDTPKSTSALAVWESTIAVAKVRDLRPTEASMLVRQMLEDTAIVVRPLPPEAGDLAVEAFERFGKGRHPAGLNFGDCFAYAAARHLGVALLYKGEDFSRTDIAAARAGD